MTIVCLILLHALWRTISTRLQPVNTLLHFRLEEKINIEVCARKVSPMNTKRKYLVEDQNQICQTAASIQQSISIPPCMITSSAANDPKATELSVIL